MKKITILILTICFCSCFNSGVFALTVTTRSTSAGFYENGEFKPDDSGFEARYVIDEDAGLIRLEKVMVNNREGKNEEGATYDITNMVKSAGLSGFMVSLGKKGQKIFTAVNDVNVGETEMIIIGETFYDYCCAANGKFYLEHGEVVRSDK